MKVKYLPFQPHCFAFGGFDMQMLNTLEAVRKSGVDAEKLDIWSRDTDFDVLHVWGVGPSNFEVIQWAKKAGKRVVSTVLLPYQDTLRSNLGYWYRRFSSGRQLMHHLKLIDRIVVLNELQLRVLKRYYGVCEDRIAVVPNIIEENYFKVPEFDFKSHYNLSGYVLCVGNISHRKNQVNLARACIEMHQDLALIGNVLDGEDSYGQQLEALISGKDHIVWIKELPKASGSLVAAYYQCAAYALVSRKETQPISALEAAALNKPLVLMDRAYARQEYYMGAVLCQSDSPKDIRKALQIALAKKGEAAPNPSLNNCRQERVGALYRECYQQLMTGPPSGGTRP
jgi:glycosyltransferase involved in cell wall biosynthesis